ncbi:sensor histidine kinase [Nocardiopsis trehalosi]|uniref:sensor histidine kinase n=1 Tax=Nocardiopsis trehalosi TaxID=109329 RepID=UPI001FE0B488|nr:histidine kinase [Nocardiopsis trehalosi]
MAEPAEPAGWGGRRGARDWCVDAALFALAAGYGVWASADVRATMVPEYVPAWFLAADQVAGALACAALWLRRRWPTALAVVLVLVSAVSDLTAGAMLVALFSVAVHRPPRVSLSVLALSVVTVAVYVAVRPDPEVPPGVLAVLGAVLQAAAVAWGLVVHSRRRLVASLKDRAVRAEAEARLRAERAQHEARDAIAREIHDVLGHRLSLLSVHAGALEYRPGMPAEDVARAAGVIRESAHRALQDLREVIGVLRAPVGELPTPALADLSALVEESRRAGMRVDVHRDVAGDVPDTAGRTAYRIVQEGLTNARKHAPGGEVEVRVAGGPGRGLAVEVGNAPPDPPAVPAPEAPDALAATGQGLVGLAERVALAGGRVEHGPTAAGGWRLAAWLPWPP